MHACRSTLEDPTFRARIHPLGKRGTYSAKQVAAIRQILADCRGAIRWGGDYKSRADEMHVEVIASEAACARVLATFTALNALAIAQSHPELRLLPPPADEEDVVDVPIRPDQSGNFRSAVKVEVGQGSGTGYTKAWVTLGSCWGDTDFIVTAQGPAYRQWSSGTRQDTGKALPFRVENNGHWAAELPAGTRTVTVEGHAGVGTVPSAAIWHVR